MKRRGIFVALAISVGGAWALGPPKALCGPEDGPGSPGAGTPVKKKGSEETTAKRSLRMEEIEIYGDVEKPKTMFVIPRSPFRYTSEVKEKDFTDEILDPITKGWAEDTQRWRGAVPPP